MNSKRLIINADDYGWCRGITDGILQAHKAGVVTSTSLMANQPASEYAIERLSEVPTLGVGVHLYLCDGRPILPASDVPSLVTPSGIFFSEHEMIPRLQHWKVPSTQIEKEFRAQITWIRARGITPTHADSHHHMHFYPSVVHAFRRAMKAEGIQCARAARHKHWPQNGYIGGSYGGPLLRRVLLSAYMGSLQQVVLRSIKLPDSSLAYHPRYRASLNMLEEGWISALKNLPTGTYELGCHPGISQAGFSETDNYKIRRELELKILTGNNFRNTVESCGIELITYRDLVRSSKSIASAA